MTIANIRLARRISEELSVKAGKARAEGEIFASVADALSCASRTLFAISAAYDLPLTVVRAWQADERAIADRTGDCGSFASAEALATLAEEIEESESSESCAEDCQ